MQSRWPNFVVLEKGTRFGRKKWENADPAWIWTRGFFLEITKLWCNDGFMTYDIVWCQSTVSTANSTIATPTKKKVSFVKTSLLLCSISMGGKEEIFRLHGSQTGCNIHKQDNKREDSYRSSLWKDILKPSKTGTDLCGISRCFPSHNIKVNSTFACGAIIPPLGSCPAQPELVWC